MSLTDIDEGSSAIHASTGLATSPAAYPPIFRALRYRNYRLYFIGQLVSWIGTWMQNVAQGWLVLRLTGSALYLGLVAAAGSLAVVALSIPAGIVVDAMSKQRLLLITQVGAMVVISFLAVAVLAGDVSVWIVVACSFLLGVTSAFDAPVRHAFMYEITSGEDLLNAIALNSSVWHVARFVGPAIAGPLVAWKGEGVVFAANALSYLGIIYCILQMRVEKTKRSAEKVSLKGIGVSFRFVAQNRPVAVVLFLAAAMSFFGFSYLPILPLYARDVLGSDVVGLGFLLSSSGVGALCAAVGLAAFSHRIRRERLLATATVIFPLGLLGLSLSSSFRFACVSVGIASWGGVTAMVLANGILQASIPNHLRGRILSLFTLCVFGIGPLGGLLLGVLIELVQNVRFMIGCSAAVTAFCAIIGMTLQSSAYPSVIERNAVPRPSS